MSETTNPPVKKKKSAKEKLDTFLSGFRKKSSDDGSSGGGGVESETLSFPSRDLVPMLNALNLQRLQLQGSLVFNVTVELSGETLKAKEKNALFKTDVGKIVRGHIAPLQKEYYDKMCEVLENCDTDPRIPIEQVQRAFGMTVDSMGERYSIQLQNLVVQYVQSNKAIKIAYRNYQVKCVVNVTQSVLVIGASIGVTAATWGATGPVAVVGIVRSCVKLGVDIYNMAIDADQVISNVEGLFNKLGSIMTEIDENTQDPKKVKLINSLKETGLGAVAGILNIPIPSVTEVKSQIELLGNKLNGMHVKRQAMGEEMAKIDKAVEKYKGEIEKHRKANDTDMDELEGYVKKAAKSLTLRQKLELDAEEMFQDTHAGVQRMREFEEQLKVYQGSISKWSMKSKLVFGFATSIGLGIGSADSGLEKGLAGLQEVLSTAQELISERI